MTFQEYLFWTLAILTCLSAMTVVLTQNIVRAAVWLLFTLAGAAGLFFLLGFDFVGATQLLVYVGGILVLIVFGVMLTAQGPFVNIKTSAGEWALSLVVGLLLLGVLGGTVFLSPWKFQPMTPQDQATSAHATSLGLSFLGVDEAMPPAKLSVHAPGDVAVSRTRMNYFLPFEIVSVHLLVVLIGAAYLARAKRRQGARTP